MIELIPFMLLAILIVATGLALLLPLVHFLFAIAVLADDGESKVLAGRFVWFLGTLLGGPLVAALYWMVHHSTLNPAMIPRKTVPLGPYDGPSDPSGEQLVHELRHEGLLKSGQPMDESEVEQYLES